MKTVARLRPALALSAALTLVLVAARAAAPAAAPRGNFSGLRNAATAAGNTLNQAAPAGNTAGAAVQSGNTTAANLQSNNSTSLESNTLLAIINKAFDADSGDMIDPENGTMKWKGHTYELGQMRIFRARFERYLALAPNADQKEYQALIDKVFATLSTNNTAANNQDKMKQAWQLLFQAAEYESDAGTALDVANQVFNTWRTQDEQTAQSIATAELNRLRLQKQAALTRTFDLAQTEALARGENLDNKLSTAGQIISGNLSSPSDSNSGSGTGGATSGTTSGGSASTARRGGTAGSGTPKAVLAGDKMAPGTGAATLLGATREQVALEATIKAQQASTALTVAQARLQFQGTIISLFLQRKFQHAIIASSFYRFIFKGSAQDLDRQFTKTLAEFIPGAGDVPFTVGMVEQLSREALNEVRRGMAAVHANYDEGRLMAALQRLQESFFLGEFLGEVAVLDKAKRQKLYDLYTKIDSARKLADLKDYAGIIRLTGEIGALTKDFRAAEVTAAASSAQNMSTLNLAGAKQAATMGDYERAQVLLEKASAIWPLNPEIASYGSGVSAGASITSQAAVMFDDAYKHAEYRRIYDRRAELTVGLLNDDQRGPQFRDVIDRISRVEMALAQAQEAVNQNNAYAAWDALAAAAALAPNDTAVNQRKAELAPRVADYVGAAEKARLAESRGETAASLAYYLAVQDINPASPLARAGLERVATTLLDRLAADSNSANVSLNATSGAPAKKPAAASAED
jgi:hypothetical protein